MSANRSAIETITSFILAFPNKVTVEIIVEVEDSSTPFAQPTNSSDTETSLFRATEAAPISASPPAAQTFSGTFIQTVDTTSATTPILTDPPAEATSSESFLGTSSTTSLHEVPTTTSPGYPLLSQPTTQPPGHAEVSSSKSKTRAAVERAIIGSVCAGIVLISLCCAVYLFARRRRERIEHERILTRVTPFIVRASNSVEHGGRTCLGGKRSAPVGLGAEDRKFRLYTGSSTSDT